ncbi:unnamed protein product [Didymodactylos carnosus]|uniref:Uncharacterized protein n=1 Tax=Didymodactylos carnosus TaxID=1234261 RepID=A0A8S2FCC1_9BILA|nr:unnamed protein product [Didymodactylos carnosus]CAF4222541.1 unnamed protein product [Didymodactylos carnosus]
MSITKYVKCGLIQSQIKSALSVDHPNTPLPTTQLSNIISYNRRKNNPEIFSVYDFRKWYNDRKDGSNSSHSTFVSYYSTDNVDNIFVLFITKQIIQQTQFATLLQVGAIYKITCNELPLLVFEAPDADRDTNVSITTMEII